MWMWVFSIYIYIYIYIYEKIHFALSFRDFFNFNPKFLKVTIYPYKVSKSDSLNLPLIFSVKLDENLWNYVITLQFFFLSI